VGKSTPRNSGKQVNWNFRSKNSAMAKEVAIAERT